MGHEPGQVIAPHLPRVQAADLAKQLEDPPSGLVVLDVRSPEEWAEGHVRGSINLPSTAFQGDQTPELDALIKDKLAGASEVVVHCKLSQVRGPTSAQALEARIKDLLQDTQIPAIKVLQGGMEAFGEAYNGTQLVEATADSQQQS